MTRILTLVLAVILVVAGGSWLLNQPRSNSGLIRPALAQDSGEAEDSGATAVDPKAMILPDIVLGDADAPVTVIEYASYTCPHCANFHDDQLKQLKADYVDTGKAKFIHREVYFDRFGLWGGLVAHCGGEMRYYGISGMLYEQQEEWIGSGQEDEIIGNLRTLGKSAGLTEDEVNTCLADQEMATKLVATFQANAEADGINATPTLVIDGQKYSNMAYSDLKAIIDAKLASHLDN